MEFVFWSFYFAVGFLLVAAVLTALTRGKADGQNRGLKFVLWFCVVVGVLFLLISIGSLLRITRDQLAAVGPTPVQTAPTISPTNAVPAEAVQTAPPVSPTNIAASSEPTPARTVMPPVVNALVNPVLHHADSHPPENGVGSFDVGVKQGQIGLAFGWHIAWPKGGIDAGGDGCDLVILTPGWYENLQVTDGRYEVYDVPSSDYPGWVRVLGQQRADEQAKDYGCPAKSFQDLPQWESTIPSPP